VSTPGLSRGANLPPYGTFYTQGYVPFASGEMFARLQVLVRMGESTGVALGEGGKKLADLKQVPSTSQQTYMFECTPVDDYHGHDTLTHLVLEEVFMPVGPHITLWSGFPFNLTVTKETFSAHRRF
jgi:hypothetical protein